MFRVLGPRQGLSLSVLRFSTKWTAFSEIFAGRLRRPADFSRFMYLFFEFMPSFSIFAGRLAAATLLAFYSFFAPRRTFSVLAFTAKSLNF